MRHTTSTQGAHGKPDITRRAPTRPISGAMRGASTAHGPNPSVIVCTSMRAIARSDSSRVSGAGSSRVSGAG